MTELVIKDSVRKAGLESLSEISSAATGRGNIADLWHTGDFEQTWRDVKAGYRDLPKHLEGVEW